MKADESPIVVDATPAPPPAAGPTLTLAPAGAERTIGPGDDAPTACPPSDVREIVVVVPAADEQEHISACLRALDAARHRLRRQRPHVAVRVVVVLDDCRDDTAQRLADHPHVEVLHVLQRCVGAARRAGAALAQPSSVGSLEHTSLEHIWIANTDADSVVPPDWLVGICRAADDGFHAVVGTVVPNAGLATELRQEWHRRHDLIEGHGHVHGANLSVRADVYFDVGGWSALRTGEDRDLLRRLQRRPATAVLRTALQPVLTSSRPDGRAPEGFSAYLRALADRTAADDLQTPSRARLGQGGPASG